MVDNMAVNIFGKCSNVSYILNEAAHDDGGERTNES